MGTDNVNIEKRNFKNYITFCKLIVPDRTPFCKLISKLSASITERSASIMPVRAKNINETEMRHKEILYNDCR